MTPIMSPASSMDSPALRFAHRLCLLCNIEDVDPVAVGEDFEYRTCRDSFLMVRCRTCGVLFLNPRPADDESSRIYPNHYHAFQFDPENFGLIYTIRRRLEISRLRPWTRGLPVNARILDVGCGDGFHLDLFRDYGQSGWKLEGLDRDERAVAAARKRGLEVHHGSLEESSFPVSSFDLILLVMTVEHLSDPVRTLRQTWNLLKPGGRLGIITDNAASPDAWLFGGRHWGGYHFPRHTVLFDRRTLAMAARLAGFEVESVRTSFSPVNWTYSLHNWLDDWGAPRWLVRQFSLNASLPLAGFTFLDVPLAMLGYGAILFGNFRRPHPTESRP